MKPPVERVKVSARGKEILTKIKRSTGLEHWNEICRIALCHSLANPEMPQVQSRVIDSNIEIEWKTFAGPLQDELCAIFFLRAKNDGLDLSKREMVADYFRAHIERGIFSMQNIKSLSEIVKSSSSELESK
jgi:DNA sulfur modification protein DndE